MDLLIGPNVLREADEIVRRKIPASLPTLAHLLETGKVLVTSAPTKNQIESAKKMVAYLPDAYVLAEAIASAPDWFVTHDKEHFLNVKQPLVLPFEIGTPGDLLQKLKGDFYLP